MKKIVILHTNRDSGLKNTSQKPQPSQQLTFNADGDKGG